MKLNHGLGTFYSMKTFFVINRTSQWMSSSFIHHTYGKCHTELICSM